ncbi:hypothetical protein [Paenibacillus thermotolerans]|uniref:hypothetical protein n=1 Tax=Paenibacillus thermotolerans TaxID=3027807 RepID=UPI00236857D8|nr:MULTISPECIES: hypothetical protein [unclassified Paenibacillus]
MRDNIVKPELLIAPGIVEGEIEDAPSRKYTAKWTIPQYTAEEKERIVDSLSSDAFLYGRWLTGAMTEQDRKAAGAAEDGWQSSCNCGRNQPCRHAVSILFRLREQAKIKPWTWLDVRGFSLEDASQAVHQRRRTMIRTHSEPPEYESELPLRIGQETPAASPIAPHAEDPPFWNRDVAFAEWLETIYTRSRKGESPS